MIKLILKRNNSDKEVIELWDKEMAVLYAIVYKDCFYSSEGDLLPRLETGEIVTVAVIPEGGN